MTEQLSTLVLTNETVYLFESDIDSCKSSGIFVTVHNTQVHKRKDQHSFCDIHLTFVYELKLHAISMLNRNSVNRESTVQSTRLFLFGTASRLYPPYLE